MPLPTLTEIQALSEKEQRAKRAKALKSLQVAKAHSQDIRLHTEAEVSPVSQNPSYGRFMQAVKGYLVEDKFKVFQRYQKFPLSTTATCSIILNQLKKVFDGKNAVRNSTYSTERVEMDFLQYLKDTDFISRWREDSFRALGTGHNDIIVIDSPQDSPEPYHYFLSIEVVHDLDVDNDGRIVFVQYWQDDTHLVHITQDGWQILETEKGKGKVLRIESEAENTTGLDVCWFWWLDNLKGNDKVVKKSPFTDYISKLDWLEFWATSKRILDGIGSNPVTWSIEEDCDFQDAERGVYCDGGFLRRNTDSSYMRGGSSHIGGGYFKCPKCSDRRFTGAGSHIEIPPPDKESDFRSPFGVVGIDAKALKNAREEEERLIDCIVKGVTGGGQEPLNQEAINVTQVSALFEGWTGILRQIKCSFEYSEAKVLEVKAALRYGGQVLQMSVNYGTEFYLMSEQEALIFYTAAREHGLPDYILDFLLNEYYTTKFRYDKKGLERVMILMAIEPFKHITKAKLVEMADKFGATREELYLKLNFGSLIQRFELENGAVTEFGVNFKTDGEGNALSKRVQKIKEVLLSYVPENPEPAPAPPPVDE